MITSRRFAPRVVVGLAAAAFAFAHLCFLLLPAGFEPWDLQVGDVLFRLRAATGWGAPRYEGQVRYIQLSDDSEDALGTPRIDRGHFAAVIEALGELGTSLQVHDTVFRGEVGGSADERLVAAARRAGNVLVGCVLRPGGTQRLPTWRLRVEGNADSVPRRAPGATNFAALAGAVRGQGFLNVVKDRDGAVRRMPLLMRGPDGGFYPGLPLLAACTHLGITPDRIVFRPGRSLVLGEIEIPVDDTGATRINFVGPWGAMKRHAFDQVYMARADENELAVLRRALEGSIALVADVRTEASDAGPVPLDPHYPLPGIHANVLHSILTGQFVRDAGTGLALAVEAVLLAALCYLGLRRSTPVFVGGVAGLLVVLAAGWVVLFVHAGIILNLVRPALMLVVATVAVLVYRYLNEERRRAIVQGTFEAFFPPSVVDRLLADPERVSVGGQRKELTVLFSDIVGFTPRTATMEPDEVQRMLNEYFAAMAEIVFAHGGTIDKFIGDGLMVFFGDPEPQPDHALRCVWAAIEMQRRVAQLASGRADPYRIRIGIHTGPMLVGNMGSPRRLSYTVLGSDVNLAARLETNAPAGGILVSASTNAAIAGAVPTNPLPPIQAKGFESPVEAYEVVLDRSGSSPYA